MSRMLRWLQRLAGRRASSRPKPVPAVTPRRYRIGIKITARSERRREWGDFHFADSLREAFGRLGHDARIDFPEDWYAPLQVADDIVIVLRGLRAYEPRPGPLNIMWNISHPDTIPYAEYESYDLVFVASLSFAEFLRVFLRVPVLPLLQATDKYRFKPPKAETFPEHDLVFVGNSRGQFRPIIRWALEAGLRPDIYGAAWRRFVPDELIKRRNVDNKRLSSLYSTARIVLNDHWDSMRQFGLVSNRVFDVLASGGTLISDSMPSLHRMFGNSVRQVSDSRTLAAAVSELEEEGTSREAVVDLASWVRAHHSFNARARTLLATAKALLRGRPLPPPDRSDDALAAPAVSRPRRFRVAVLANLQTGTPTPGTFARIICPLTSEDVSDRVEIAIHGSWTELTPGGQDAVVVEADRKISPHLWGIGSPGRFGSLLVDIAEPFPPIGPRRARDFDAKTVAEIVDQGSAVVFGTDRLRASLAARPPAHVVPDTLDPRLWRTYKRADHEGASRVLWMRWCETAETTAAVLAALDIIVGERPAGLIVTAIGGDCPLPERSWLSRPRPPADTAAYPRWAKWLRGLGPFDIGLAPSTFEESGGSDTAQLIFRALGCHSIVAAADPPPGLTPHRAVGTIPWFEAISAAADRSRADAAIQVELANDDQRLWGERSAEHAGLALCRILGL